MTCEIIQFSTAARVSPKHRKSIARAAVPSRMSRVELEQEPERPSSSSCFAAHRSTFSINSSDRRIARTGSFPVAGRPGFRFSITLFDRLMNM